MVAVVLVWLAALAAAPAELRLAGDRLTVVASGAAVPIDDPAAACPKLAGPVRPLVEIAADAPWEPVAAVLELIGACGRSEAGLVVAAAEGAPKTDAIQVSLSGAPPPTFVRVLAGGQGLVIHGLELAGLGAPDAQPAQLAALAGLEGAVAVEGGRDVAAAEVLRVLRALTLVGGGPPKLPRILFREDQVAPETLSALMAIRSFAPASVAKAQPVAQPSVLRPIFGAVENVRFLEVTLPGWTQQDGGICKKPDGTVIAFAVGLSTSNIWRAQPDQAEARAKQALPTPPCAEASVRVKLPETAAPVDAEGRFLVPEDVDVHGPDREGQPAGDPAALLSFALVPGATADAEAAKAGREALQRWVAGKLSFAKDRFSAAAAACAAEAPRAIASGAGVRLVEAPAALRRVALASVATAAAPALLSLAGCAGAARAEVLEQLLR